MPLLNPYQVNVKAEKEIGLVLKAIQRLAAKQGLEADDLLQEFSEITNGSRAKK